METKVAEKATYVSREEKNGLNQDLLQKYFDYSDGRLIWKKQKCTAKKGAFAGYVRALKDGDRRYISINGSNYAASRLIFLWHNNYLTEVIDHENRNKLDDRIGNLRPATFSQNCKNRTSSNKSSKYLGVLKVAIKEKRILKNKLEANYINFYWKVCIVIDGKQKQIGYLKNEVEAALLYNKWAVKYHGEFANLNIIKP